MRIMCVLTLLLIAVIAVILAGCGSDPAQPPPPPPTATPIPPPTPTAPVPAVDLSHPGKKDAAMQIVTSAENSSLDWRAQYGYIEDIGDGRGYTAGIIGFCSGTGDMLELIRNYTQQSPDNVLAKYIPALSRIMTLPESQHATHKGLDPTFVSDWHQATPDPLFQQAQEHERDSVYFEPAINQAKADGLRALGQFIYYDSAVMHGFEGSMNVRQVALSHAKPPSQGGDEATFLNAYLDARVAEMSKEAAHSDFSRVETAQRIFLRTGNLDLNLPLRWRTYGNSYSINPR